VLGLGRVPGAQVCLVTLPPVSGRRKRSYKQAVSELDEEQPLEEDEELQPPWNKTPSPPCPASKVRRLLSLPCTLSCLPRGDPCSCRQVVRPLRTFLHTVQRNQMLMTPTLMTPTSASRSSVMKSFIKRNTPLRVDPKVRDPVP
jgi:inner centromere protein